jgi:hypothetical protein
MRDVYAIDTGENLRNKGAMKTTKTSVTRITSLIATFGAAVLMVAAGCGSSSPASTPDARPVVTPDAPPVTQPDAPPVNTIDAAANQPDAADMSPDASPLSMKICDPTVQDCANNQKCTIQDNADGTVQTVCLTPSGSKGDMAVCMRAGGVVGVDDCAAGFFCSGLTEPADASGTAIMRLCRPYCATNTNCTDSNQSCINLDGLNPPDGICIPSGCTLITDAGCANGTTCQLQLFLDGTMNGSPGTYCNPVGNVEAGGDCTSAANRCDVGLQCLATSNTAAACFVICDDSHPCAMGMTCSPGGGTDPGAPVWPMNAGFCQ